MNFATTMENQLDQSIILGSRLLCHMLKYFMPFAIDWMKLKNNPMPLMPLDTCSSFTSAKLLELCF